VTTASALDGWISAGEAARRLGVKLPTLYAYVSRGLIRSAAKRGATRERVYAHADVERLRRRGEERRVPEAIARHALDLGTPVLESSITLIDREHLYYRGYDAVELARSRSVAEVASLIWTGSFDSVTTVPIAPAKRFVVDHEHSFIARAQAMLATAASHDPTSFDLRLAAVAATGAKILGLMTRAAGAPRPTTGTIDGDLAAAWGVRGSSVDVLRAATILCADHELNVSAFTARCVASAGSSPYAAVIAGLAALEGVRHGGLTARVESMLASMRRSGTARAALGERLRNGEAIDGFGHPLYPNGDPRGRALLAMLRERYPRSPELKFALEVVSAVASALESHPTIDFALATLARVLDLPPRSGLTVFATGRAIGWIGHAIEQYGTGQLIRPRARYVGPAPGARPAAVDADER
jgi:citrate synthase